MRSNRRVSSHATAWMALVVLCVSCDSQKTTTRAPDTAAKSTPSPAPTPERSPITVADSGTPLASLPAQPGVELIAAPERAGRASSGRAFVDVTRKSGIRHRHQKGVFDPRLANIMPWISSIGSAAAVSDYDGDGDIDLYVTSSRIGTANALYRNEGDLRFTDVAEEAGVANVNDTSGVSMDVAFADLDGDGDDDLYVVKWGKNQLFRNDGGGKFTDITDAAGVGDKGNANCILPFDYDNDGRVDLLVCNYFPNVDLRNLEHTRIMHDSFEAARNGGANTLYRNLGDLRFEDVAHGLQLDDTGWSLDAGISDIDNDGDVDLYIANDFGQDKLFLNNGNGTFTDFTMTSIGPETFKGMNVDFGDFNNDGFTDIYVTNITTDEYLKEGNFLWLNGGDQTFTNVSATTRTAHGGWGWCGRFLDFDLDGDLDILTVNGFVSAGKEAYWESLANVAVDPTFEPVDATQWPEMGGLSLSGHEATRLFRNKGDGAFEDVAGPLGIGHEYDGRGIALADFDEDGDLDVYFANQDAPGMLYRNDAGGRRRWLKVDLVGTRSNRNAIGARVQVTAIVPGEERPMQLTREVTGVNGYASQSSYRIHFGLGMASRVQEMTIFWPSGVVQELEDLGVDRHYRVTEMGEPADKASRLARYFAVLRERDVASGAGNEASPTRILELEARLRRKPRNASLGNIYRYECVEGRYFDRSIEFFRGLLRQTKEQPAVRLQLALALIDKIPTLTNDAIKQASIAKESLSQLGLVEERYPDSYGVHYIAGMNHLYWPAGLRHHAAAVRDFEICLKIQEERARAGRPLEPHYVEIYLALGDAHVKGKDTKKAKEAWTEGMRVFPRDPRFAERLAQPLGSLIAVVKSERGLQTPIDTRLAMLLDENGLSEKEAALTRDPSDREVLNSYRLEAYELEVLDRAETFLRDLSTEKDTSELSLHRAMLVADRINENGKPDESAGTLRERHADLSRQLLVGVEKYSKSAKDEWLGPYLAGVYRIVLDSAASTLDGSGDVVGFLRKAVELCRREDGSPRVPYACVALGDALVLAGDIAGARAQWGEAAKLFPRDRALASRQRCADATLVSLLRSEYDLDRGLPTDLERLVDRDAALSLLESKLSEAPTRELADRYRRAAIENEDLDRGVRFLRELLKMHPRSADVRVQLALALIDRTPDRSLGSVRKGLLSSQALDALEPVIEAFPDNWGLRYLHGLIHLNWFTKLKHLPYAIQSFEKCLALQAGKEEGNRRYALAYRAMGDALVKQGQFAHGRIRYWKPGLKRFPDDRGLKERISLTAHMVDAYVGERRSWNFRQDTWLVSEIIGHISALPTETAHAGGN